MRINRYSESTTVIIDWRDSPRHRGLPAARSANLKIIANPVNPLAKTTLIDPPAKIVNFIL
jgi:hypothetical protein